MFLAPGYRAIQQFWEPPPSAVIEAERGGGDGSGLICWLVSSAPASRPWAQVSPSRRTRTGGGQSAPPGAGDTSGLPGLQEGVPCWEGWDES